MTREDHLAWCKKRALEYLDRGDLSNAVASMGSDLTKHPETAMTSPLLIQIGMMEVINANAEGVRRWITGFN